MKLTDQPIVVPDGRLHERVKETCIRLGRRARQLGFSINDCPSFVDPDMTVNWRFGWRWEDEELRRRK